MRSFYQPLALGDPCAGRKLASESETASENVSATSAVTGTSSPSSVPPSNVAEDEAVDANIADPNIAPVEEPAFVVDGWKCESFAHQTGHAIGRAATIGDFQICVTVVETDGSEPQAIPQNVIRWLLTGEQ